MRGLWPRIALTGPWSVLGCNGSWLLINQLLGMFARDAGKWCLCVANRGSLCVAVRVSQSRTTTGGFSHDQKHNQRASPNIQFIQFGNQFPWRKPQLNGLLFHLCFVLNMVKALIGKVPGCSMRLGCFLLHERASFLWTG